MSPAPPAAFVRTERQEEQLGDRLMGSLGFEVLRFSQPRNTMQTEGIADRRYYRGTLTVWWEAKREGGKQRKAQQWFEALVTAAGEDYVCGPLDTLIEWLVARGVVTRLPSGALQIVKAVSDYSGDTGKRYPGGVFVTGQR